MVSRKYLEESSATSGAENGRAWKRREMQSKICSSPAVIGQDNRISTHTTETLGILIPGLPDKLCTQTQINNQVAARGTCVSDLHGHVPRRAFICCPGLQLLSRPSQQPSRGRYMGYPSWRGAVYLPSWSRSMDSQRSWSSNSPWQRNQRKPSSQWAQLSYTN